MTKILFVAFWLLACRLLYKPLFNLLLINEAKAQPTEKLIVAILACLSGVTLCFLISAIILICSQY